MNIHGRFKKRSRLAKQLAADDMKYLQRKISGRSVYKALDDIQVRKPKHRIAWHT